jgi:hypothetical protein
MARKCGLGIKGDQTVRVINAKPPSVKDDDSAFDIFNISQVWTAEQKQIAIKKIMEALKVGVPFLIGVRFAGIGKRTLNEWIEAEPDLLNVLLQAEAEWAVYFFKCLSKGAQVAAEKGKFSELVTGAERRFPAQWAQIQAIDLTMRKEETHESTKQTDDVTIDLEFERELEKGMQK